MIDFIKIEVAFYDRNRLLKNTFLDFKGDYSMSTGNIDEAKIVAEYYGIKFISFQSQRLILQGSIHKYYNFLTRTNAPNQVRTEQKAKGFNGNTFNLTQLKYSINHLCSLIKIEPKEAILRSFEYGLNIAINQECQTFLSSLIRHKCKEFSSIKERQQYFRQAKSQRFIVKCYDKQIQYGISQPTIRFENKQIKMIDLKQLPIKNLADLTDKSNLDNLKKSLLKKWDEVTMYDFTIQKAQLNRKEIDKIKDLSNPIFWQSMQSNHTHRHKKKLKELSITYGENIHVKFRDQLTNQWANQNQHCVTFNQLFENQNV